MKILEKSLANHESIVEHLKMFQGIINCMAQIYFILKGWITVMIAILGVAVSTSKKSLDYLPYSRS